jgi:hypothetical protein
LDHLKLFVFVNSSFANNKDFSSQIGYVMILANEKETPTTNGNKTPTANGNPNGTDRFIIKGNLIHYSSTKCKRVTRSVLASEIYGMVGGVNIAVAVNTTIKIITDQLGFSHPVIIVCTDSYLLYKCLVKLSITKEKHLMINIMALCQSYKRQEIAEIRWINGKDNPANTMTKSTPNKALERFLDSNQLNVQIEGWVQR